MWCNLPKENAENNPKKPTFVDIGANIGQHSLFMSQIVPHVVAFEPFSNVNTKFKHHIDINEIDNIILTTKFEILKNHEQKYGFSESSKNSNFFRIGKKNQWEKTLTNEQIRSIEGAFEKKMKEFNYL